MEEVKVTVTVPVFRDKRGIIICGTNSCIFCNDESGSYYCECCEDVIMYNSGMKTYTPCKKCPVVAGALNK